MVAKVVIQGCHRNALCQVDVTADSYGADDGVVQTDAGIVADDNVAHRVVDAAEGFDDAVIAQREASIGWGIHADGMVNYRVVPTVLIEWSQQANVPSWPRLHLVHDEPVEQLFKLWILL